MQLHIKYSFLFCFYIYKCLKLLYNCYVIYLFKSLMIINRREKNIKNIISEFKTFIERGNVIDLAVGVVVGSAFSGIVNSIVNDILMPFIGIILGGLDFSNLSFKIGESVILFGSFINNVINFFIISICVFFLVKFINKITKKKTKEEVKEIKRSDEVLLLEEIRDELRKNNKKSSK